MSVLEIILSVCVLFLILILSIRIKKEEHTIRRIEKMINEATEGKFLEQKYDEDVLSKLEVKFANYLSATEVAEKKIEDERDRIKVMISDVSHQTKTPIANLKLYSELLREDSLSKSASENVESIYLQVEKLSFLIDTLIKLSRLENGIIKPNPQNNHITKLLKGIESQFSSQAESKGLRLLFEEQDCIAKYDLKWTLEAVGNIIDNAIKYMEKGVIKVKVTSYQLFVRIDIIDSGIGINETEKEKIFSRFYRSNRVSEKSGLGIGLYLTREIILEEGGYIKVSSNEYTGTTFSVYIPKG